MDPTEETVSKTDHLRRLAAKQIKIDELSAALSTAQETIRAAPDLSTLERLEADRDRLTSEFETYRSETATRTAILAAGITDSEDIELVRWRHSRMPEDDRPDLDTFLKGAAREDRHLRHLFEGASEPSRAAGGQEADPGPADTGRHGAEATSANGRRGLPNVNGGTKGTPGPGDTWTLEHIAAMDPRERLKPENRARIDEVLASNR